MLSDFLNCTLSLEISGLCKTEIIIFRYIFLKCDDFFSLNITVSNPFQTYMSESNVVYEFYIRHGIVIFCPLFVTLVLLPA